MATLAEKVENLRSQLGLAEGMPMVQTVDAACEQLGVEGEVGRSLVDRANRCYVLLGSPPL